MSLKLVYLVASVFSLSLLSTTVADDAVFKGEGETVWPVVSKDIEMVAETVMVNRGKDGWDANCIFVLKNTGEATQVQVGFPDLTDVGPGADLNKGTIENFRCYLDGVEAQIEHKRGLPNPLDQKFAYPFAYVWKMSFEKGQQRVVRNTYSFGGTLVSDGTIKLNYILRTGALWKGTIKSGLIVFDLGKLNPRFTHFIRPPGYKISSNSISWTFRNLKPKNDIEISLSPLIQEWFEETQLYAHTDSIEVLKRLLEQADWLLERRPSKHIQKDFILRYDRLITQFEKYGNTSRYRALKALRTGKDKEANKYLRQFLAELNGKPLPSHDDMEFIDKFTSMGGCTFDDLEICKGFYEVLLKDVERRISLLDTIPDLTSKKRYSYLFKLQEDYKAQIESLSQLITEKKDRQR